MHVHEHACVEIHMPANLDLEQYSCTSKGLLCCSPHIIHIRPVCDCSVWIFAYLKYEIALSIIIPVEKWNLCEWWGKQMAPGQVWDFSHFILIIFACGKLIFFFFLSQIHHLNTWLTDVRVQGEGEIKQRRKGWQILCEHTRTPQCWLLR